MAVEYLTLQEAIDLLDMPSDVDDDEKVRMELEKFNFKNGTQFILENK